MPTATGKKGKKLGPVHTAFGIERQVELESGRSLVIPKWSVVKAIRMGESISGIMREFWALFERRMDDDGNVEIDVKSIIEAIPELLHSCADDIATVMEESLTLKGGKKQLTKNQILGVDEEDPDNLDLDEFPEVLGAIIERNITEKTVGKWKGLLMNSLGALTREEPKKAQP